MLSSVWNLIKLLDCIKIVRSCSRILHAVTTTYRYKRDLFFLLRKIRELYLHSKLFPYIGKVINRNIGSVSILPTFCNITERAIHTQIYGKNEKTFKQVRFKHEWQYPVQPNCSICRSCSWCWLGTASFYILCERFVKCPWICFIVTCMLMTLYYVDISPWNMYLKN